MRHTTTHRRSRALAGTALAAALLLSACGGGNGDDGGNGGAEGGGGGDILIGTTDVKVAIDPAGSYDNASFLIMNQVYPFLLNSRPGESEVEPDIAETAEFTGETEFTVTLKEGLTFANGNELTSSDVKFSFDRQTEIMHENGPAYLLGNLESVETPDEQTVVFHLAEPDQTFPQVLSSPVAPIVDEEVFPADELLPDDDIVAEQAFAGPYVIDDYSFNDIVTLSPNEAYDGLLGAPENDSITIEYFSESSNLRMAVEQGDVDIAYRTLLATDIDDLRDAEGLNIVEGPGGEIRYLVFNLAIMPYGSETEEADPEAALAIRQAVADILDREEISEQAFLDTYTPLYSFVPEGLPGANQALMELYGDGNGGPDPDRAADRLEEAGVETPVELHIEYGTDRYGEASADEYAMIRDQLNDTGLFDVTIQSTEWTQFTEERTQDIYPVHQLGWFPDYPDADNYLSPFFHSENFLANHFSDEEVDEALIEQVTEEDPEEREAKIEELQYMVGEHLPTLPMQQGSQIAVTADYIDGVVLDASFKLRFGSITAE
ncbi:ABC transporter substrate-binding protein [Nesterenkonia sp.]|uniref:ABC transporter substrate-binding protein n=1 Tax=Nesterenkonia sp. TaxID=704201 RepID=UPI002603089F|nr:ABC transporter substrate-binding protein [Nesterenkonia sp.]